MVGVLLGTVAWSGNSAAEILPAGADGWHTWQVDEPSASTEMCCISWKRGDQSRGGCNLDGNNISFSDSGDCAAAPGTIQVYVRLANGTPREIRVLSSNCSVTTESTVVDHGQISIDENINWFRSIIENKGIANDVREEALLALVISGSNAAYVYLDGLLTRT
jgi:hypothetical protein